MRCRKESREAGIKVLKALLLPVWPRECSNPNAAIQISLKSRKGKVEAMEIVTNLSNEIARYLDLDTRQIQLTSANMANLVSTLGASVSETTTQNTALAASVTQLQTQVSSLSGVSLDDEASNLEEFQRSYQAASQVFTILNSVFASALNLGVETAVA